jgi:hypothetical protein
MQTFGTPTTAGKKGLDEKAIVSITGRSLNVVKQYIKLYKNFNPQKAKK